MLLFSLLSAHLVVIAASNYLVQFPFQIWNLHNTWGAFTFPLIFLATDLTTRIYGANKARKVIFAALLPALLISYVISIVFADGKFAGFAGLSDFNLDIARIALASFMAYGLGQLLDISVFTRLKHIKFWWFAPGVSTFVASAFDTLVFFFIAFYAANDPYMAEFWPHIALTDFAFKISVSWLFFLPAYGITLNYVSKRLLSY